MNGVMSEARQPRISVGLPVYNGGRYLRLSIDSIIGQTYSDFELIISDNASTDATEEICREYAAQDERIKYHRNSKNLGGFVNHYRVLELATGEYFMWAAHDDIRGCDYLASCVEILDSRPDVVLCYSETRNIDEEGRELPAGEIPLRSDAPEAHARFREMIRMEYRLEPIYGLMRIDVLHRTALQGQFADSDRVKLAELALHGRFHRIPRPLFFRREHASRSIRMHPGRQARAAWIHPESAPLLTFPYHRQFVEYLRAIHRSRIGGRDLLLCYLHMARWLWRNARLLWSDIDHAMRTLLSPVIRALRHPRS
jgi:glycosyltransferase involved in cell wall biosynthesis